MAGFSMSRSFIWMLICTCLAVCVASPTRRQFITITETTSSDPAAVTNDASAWDDTDDFDLDGDQWMSHEKPSPSSIPERQVYEYDDDDDDYPSDQDGKVLVDFGDDEETVEHQDAEEEDTQNKHDSEFLFLPSRDTRLLLEDDDDDSGPIKVRHTGRSSYSRVIDVDNSVDTDEDKGPFEFTIDEEDDDEDKEDDDDDDDLVAEGAPQKVSSIDNLSRHEDPDDEDDDEEFEAEGDDEPMFESPEEDAAQVIYGDHVFLY